MKKILFLVAFLVGYLFSLDINTATEDELMQISGVSKDKAVKIIKLREKLGGKFESDKEILGAKIGVGKKTLENIKKDIKKSDKKSKTNKKNLIKKPLL